MRTESLMPFSLFKVWYGEHWVSKENTGMPGSACIVLTRYDVGRDEGKSV